MYKGVLLAYSNRAWIPFDGVLPVDMLTRLQHCLLRVEEALQAMRDSLDSSGRTGLVACD